jgi:methionine aminopeptidase
LLTAEAFSDEASTLDGDNPAPANLSASVRALGDALRSGVDMAVVGQRARTIRKAIVPTIAAGRV